MEDFFQHIGKLKQNIIRAIFAFIILCSLVVFLIVGVLSFWLYYPYEPLVIKKIEIIGTPKVGELFVYKITYKKSMDLKAQIIRQIVDDNVTTIPAIDSHVPLTKGETSIGSFVMPRMPADKYKFRWVAIYQVNPLRTVSVIAETKCFKLN